MKKLALLVSIVLVVAVAIPAFTSVAQAQTAARGRRDAQHQSAWPSAEYH